MTENELKAADMIIHMAGFTGHTKTDEVIRATSLNLMEVKTAGVYLKGEGFITGRTFDVWNEEYSITATGLEFRKSQKKFAEYLAEKEEKQKTQAAKADRDDEIKDLQKQDLITKLNTINPNQLTFWKSQMERNKQATLIAIISAIFSLIAMLKSFGYL